MPDSVFYHTRLLSIIGDILRIALPERARAEGSSPSFGDLAEVRDEAGRPRIAQVVKLDEEGASLQVFSGAKGLTTRAKVRFLGHAPDVAFSPNILGRVFGGDGAPLDRGPPLDMDPRINISGPSVNPVRRKLASSMIRTDIPMIDVFNCLVESQKIPIFSVSGEPYNQLLARVGIQADADVVVFGGLGLLFDDYWRFRQTFEDAGVFMPGGDITHPVPDNTGYITEGQFYLHDGVIDPFGSLSRLKQNVIGKRTREDHGAVMNTMIRLYSEARDAQQKQAMAFELSDYDRQLLKFGRLFRDRFMNIGIALPLEKALDLGWETMAECFGPEQLLMKQALIDRYYPKQTKSAA